MIEHECFDYRDSIGLIYFRKNIWRSETDSSLHCVKKKGWKWLSCNQGTMSLRTNNDNCLNSLRLPHEILYSITLNHDVVEITIFIFYFVLTFFWPHFLCSPLLTTHLLFTLGHTLFTCLGSPKHFLFKDCTPSHSLFSPSHDVALLVRSVSY